MSPRLLFALALGGLPVGAMYALQAMGIVLIYKTSRVFNFAQGAIGMVAAFVASSVSVSHGLPAVVGVTVGLLTGIGIGAVIERFTMRPTEGNLRRTVITLGWLLALQGIAGVLFGTEAGRGSVNLFPKSTALNFSSLGVAFGWDQIGVVVVALAVAGGLGWFFRSNSLGVAMRAVADGRESAQLLGVNVRRVSRTAWMLGAGLGALSGILVTPLLGTLNTVTLVIFTVQALAAALVGGLTSLPLTFAGGIALGVAQPVVANLLGNPPGINELIALVVVVGALLFRRRSGRSDVDTGGLAVTGVLPLPTGRRALVVVAGVALVAGGLPFVLGAQANYNLVSLLAWGLAVLSIVLLTGMVGQVSLCQAVFMAVGGFGAGIAVQTGAPFPVALLAGGLLAAVAATIVGLPALRLKGLELAVATLALAFTADRYFFQFQPLVGSSGPRPVPRPGFADQVAHGLTGARLFTLIAVVVFLALAWGVASLRRGRTGAALTALRTSEAATSAMGFSPTALKLKGFALSGFIAGIAGALYAGLIGVASSAPFNFTRSISLVAFAVIAGVGSVPGALVGGGIVLFSTMSFGSGQGVASGFLASAITLTTGLALMGTIIVAPGGIAGLVRRFGVPIAGDDEETGEGGGLHEPEHATTDEIAVRDASDAAKSTTAGV